MKIDTSEFITNNQEPSTKFYTLLGLESFLDAEEFPRLDIDSDNVFAKAIQNKPGKQLNSRHSYGYYIKTNPNKTIHNPIELYTLKEKDNMSFLNNVCKTETVFTEVSEQTFNKYINFLKTKNTRWLDAAQRDVK